MGGEDSASTSALPASPHEGNKETNPARLVMPLVGPASLLPPPSMLPPSRRVPDECVPKERFDLEVLLDDVSLLVTLFHARAIRLLLSYSSATVAVVAGSIGSGALNGKIGGSWTRRASAATTSVDAPSEVSLPFSPLLLPASLSPLPLLAQFLPSSDMRLSILIASISRFRVLVSFRSAILPRLSASVSMAPLVRSTR